MLDMYIDKSKNIKNIEKMDIFDIFENIMIFSNAEWKCLI